MSWLSSSRNKKVNKPINQNDGTNKSTKLLGPGVRDKTGKISEYSSAEDKCPVCSSDRYLNPSLRLLVSPCYHKMCESCIDRLFTLGPEPCPICGKIIRKTAFVAQTFEDLGVEKEVAIRRRVAKAYNLTVDDFHDLRSYNDYLEEVEDITYNLINNIDIPATEAKIRAHQTKHASSIISNSAKEVADAEAVHAEEERERKEREARANEARKELELEKYEKDQDKEALLRELEHSSKSAERVLAKQKSKALKRSSARINNQFKPLPIPTNTFPPDQQNLLPLAFEDKWDPLYDENDYNDYSDLFELKPNIYADGFKGAEVVIGGEMIGKAGGWSRIPAWERAIKEGISEWTL